MTGALRAEATSGVAEGIGSSAVGADCAAAAVSEDSGKGSGACAELDFWGGAVVGGGGGDGCGAADVWGAVGSFGVDGGSGAGFASKLPTVPCEGVLAADGVNASEGRGGSGADDFTGGGCSGGADDSDSRRGELAVKGVCTDARASGGGALMLAGSGGEGGSSGSVSTR